LGILLLSNRCTCRYTLFIETENNSKPSAECISKEQIMHTQAQATVAGSRIDQLADDARMAAEQILVLFERTNALEACVTTEIGWTVAATLAHLAASYAPGLTRSVIERSRAGKSLSVPDWIIHLSNWVGKLQNRRRPLAQSRDQFERDLRAALEKIADVTDADLDRRITVPLMGETTLDNYLRYVFIGHLEEHGAQIRRALASRVVAGRAMTR
jgi:hypothetical protein